MTADENGGRRCNKNRNYLNEIFAFFDKSRQRKVFRKRSSCLQRSECRNDTERRVESKMSTPYCLLNVHTRRADQGNRRVSYREASATRLNLLPSTNARRREAVI